MSKTNTSQCLRLYLIRHGEVEDAEAGKLIGQTDVALSERGIEQARRLAEKLAAAQLSAIYSSDLQRASLTAKVIAERSRMKVQLSAAWREINMGAWEGRLLAALHNEALEQITRLFSDPASFEYPNGESFGAFTARVQGALDQLLMTHRSGEIALVAHGGVCRAIIGGVLGMPMHNWLRLAQKYGCLNVIDWHDLNPMLELLNLESEAWGNLPTLEVFSG
ncbi:MAG: alpha-ribazole phosphatase [Blastocatellia bacterium]